MMTARQEFQDSLAIFRAELRASVARASSARDDLVEQIERTRETIHHSRDLMQDADEILRLNRP